MIHSTPSSGLLGFAYKVPSSLNALPLLVTQLVPVRKPPPPQRGCLGRADPKQHTNFHHILAFIVSLYTFISYSLEVTVLKEKLILARKKLDFYGVWLSSAMSPTSAANSEKKKFKVFCLFVSSNTMDNEFH